MNVRSPQRGIHLKLFCRLLSCRTVSYGSYCDSFPKTLPTSNQNLNMEGFAAFVFSCSVILSFCSVLTS